MLAPELHRICAEAGLPENQLQVVQGTGEVIGAALVAHRCVCMVSFTGGTESVAGRLRHPDLGAARRSVWINTYKHSSISSPFGGFNNSGIGREKGIGGLRLYDRIKSMYFGLHSQPLSIAR